MSIVLNIWYLWKLWDLYWYQMCLTSHVENALRRRLRRPEIEEETRRCNSRICTQEGVSTSLPSPLHLFSQSSPGAHRTKASHLRFPIDELLKPASFSGTKQICHMICAEAIQINLKDQKGEEFTSGESKMGTWPRLSTSGMALMQHYPAEQVWLTAQSWGTKTGKCASQAFEMQIPETQRWGSYLPCRLYDECLWPTHVVHHVMELIFLSMTRARFGESIFTWTKRT